MEPGERAPAEANGVVGDESVHSRSCCSGARGRLIPRLFLGLIVVAAGVCHWRRLRPRSAQPGPTERLRNSVAIEFTAAALVVGITSFLVAVPPPTNAVEATGANPAMVVEP